MTHGYEQNRPETAQDIREAFTGFFQERGHTQVPSSPLIPQNDPTLLFTNAGMVQFKDVFLGRDRLPFRRATTIQKCVRAGGKHNDLENVGHTPRHHTFFEMMGNFSFGDYFKDRAIQYAWEFLIDVMGFSPERLWVTVYEDDGEAERIWRDDIGVSPERIVRLGDKDNFWAMGDTGPCGPCSEIIYDQGEAMRCSEPVCAIGECDCDRWLEVWNLVFMQYNRDDEGNLTPLPRPSIDTGLGLERAAVLSQGVESSYDTDLFVPIIEGIEELSGIEYDPGPNGFPFRVIADHIRTCTFLISDGVFPGNEGRGYVLRRILRRAVRLGTVLGLVEPFLYRLVDIVVDRMGAAYPELMDNTDYVKRIVQVEEERFHQTLEQGMEILDRRIEQLRAEGKSVIPGEVLFELYDTFGFPPDITEDVAQEAGMDVDLDGFGKAMEEQRRRAREAQAGRPEPAVVKLHVHEPTVIKGTQFVGYETMEAEAAVAAILVDNEQVEEASRGTEVTVVLDRTPFYAESGGQVGDAGDLVARDGEVMVRVNDTTANMNGQYLHQGVVTAGTLCTGEAVLARVDGARRQGIMRNHTATHLLHRALKNVLGDHVNQAGSLVAPDRLRFDFTHFEALADEELRRVEDQVNTQVLEDLPVRVVYTSMAEALEAGAIALFGEKYAEEVRVVSVGNYSMELCGGTHVPSSGAIGLFKVISESSIGSGLRRIEAVTGLGALDLFRRYEGILQRAAGKLRSSPEQLVEKVTEVREELQQRERRLRSLQDRMAQLEAVSLVAEAETIGRTSAVVGEVDVADMNALRTVGDAIKGRLESGVILLGMRGDGKANLVCMATGDVVESGFHAGRLISEVAKVAGGGGGGRPDMAQAGGSSPERLGQAMEKGRELLRQQLREDGCE